MRKANIERNSKETQIICSVNLDGSGKYNISTPIGFFSHMLDLFSKHSLIDLDLEAKGDVNIDQHHTVEDTGLVLGKAILEALGGMKGINRAGYFVMPMDESLAVVALDISGRPYLGFDADFSNKKQGELDIDLIEEFFRAIANNLKANIHIKLLGGKNDHHKIEAIFKCFARALKAAVSKDKKALNDLPSTKGLLD
ncbi:MAG: imidazoleglycerol-phosphate dehydratase HisB [Nanoarchaeota archaeon]|nr:imidazoleglycerol-phosphate dehydratase HisB [Nanoarchaeota archaeon]